MEEIEELKPCPFCGGQAISRRINANMHYDKFIERWRTECGVCGAHPGIRGYEHVLKKADDDDEYIIVKDGLKESIDAWNNRFVYDEMMSGIKEKAEKDPKNYRCIYVKDIQAIINKKPIYSCPHCGATTCLSVHNFAKIEVTGKVIKKCTNCTKSFVAKDEGNGIFTCK